MPLGDRARAFDVAAGAYEHGRPEYPQAALDWWGERGGLPTDGRVLDLAAGTGKLARLLRARGCDVVAVEPLANMRREFSLAVPGVRVLDGTAEDIPLDDSSMAAVYAAQAFHWFDPVATIPEILRVLRPGAGLGLIWNIDNLNVEWVAEMARLKRDVGGRADPAEAVEPLGEAFVIESAEIEWAMPTTAERLVSNLRSRSYFAVLPDDERERRMQPLLKLLENVVDPVEHPMVAHVFWCVPR